MTDDLDLRVEKLLLRATIYNSLGWILAIGLVGTFLIRGIAAAVETHYTICVLNLMVATGSGYPVYWLWYQAAELKLNARYPDED